MIEITAFVTHSELESVVGALQVERVDGNSTTAVRGVGLLPDPIGRGWSIETAETSSELAKVEVVSSRQTSIAR